MGISGFSSVVSLSEMLESEPGLSDGDGHVSRLGSWCGDSAVILRDQLDAPAPMVKHASSLDQCPDDVLNHIASFCDPKSACSLARTAKCFQPVLTLRSASAKSHVCSSLGLNHSSIPAAVETNPLRCEHLIDQPMHWSRGAQLPVLGGSAKSFELVDNGSTLSPPSVVTVDQVGGIQLWRASTDQGSIWSCESIGPEISDSQSVVASDDGRHILSIERLANSSRMWSKIGDDQWQSHSLDNGSCYVVTGAMDAEGNTVVTGSIDGSMRIWAQFGGTWMAKFFQDHDQGNMVIKVSRTGDDVVSLGSEGQVHWRRRSSHHDWSTATLTVPNGAKVTSVNMDNQFERMVAGCDDGTIVVWSLADQSIWQSERESDWSNGHVKSCEFSNDRQAILATFSLKGFGVWQCESSSSWAPQPIATCAEACSKVQLARISPESTTILTTVANRTREWAQCNDEWMIQAERPVAESGIVSVQASLDGLWAAGTASDFTTRVYSRRGN